MSKATDRRSDEQKREFIAGFEAGLLVVGVPCAILLLFVIF